MDNQIVNGDQGIGRCWKSRHFESEYGVHQYLESHRDPIVTSGMFAEWCSVFGAFHIGRVRYSQIRQDPNVSIVSRHRYQKPKDVGAARQVA